MAKRQDAMKWWHNLSSAQKTRLCDVNVNLLGNTRRWETLTGSEIEQLFDDENKSDAEIIEMAFSDKKNKGTQRSPFGMFS